MTVADTPRTRGRGEHGRVGPILIVAAVAVVAFVVALVAFRGGSKTTPTDVATGTPTTVAGGQASGCPAGTPDPHYTVTMESDPSPPKAESTTFHLTVLHDGKPVTGAKVCMTSDMTEMHHEGIYGQGTEVSGGRYDATLKFGMRGPYAGTVIITDAGKAVSAPITFDVT